MAKFGATSLKQYNTLCEELQLVCDRAIQVFDFSIVEGFRGEAAQNQAFMKGASKVKWPNGKHNKLPSDAMDLAPYPVDWSDEEDAIRRFVYLAGFVVGIASGMGITLRWGGDWNSDRDIRDEKGKLRDWGHFEVIREAA